MTVLLGHVFDSFTGAVVGTEFIETDHPSYPIPDHPATGKKANSVLEVISHLNDNPQAREAGGWHVHTRFDGENSTKSRWERLVEACNHPSAPANHRALNLKADSGGV